MRSGKREAKDFHLLELLAEFAEGLSQIFTLCCIFHGVLHKRFEILESFPGRVC